MKSLAGFASSLAGEPWAMEPRALKSFFARLEGLNLESREIASATSGAGEPMAILFASAPARKSKPVKDGVATIPISGTLMKSVPNILRWLGFEATAYSEIVSELQAALVADDVKEIRLQVDSPGGQVAGVAEAADAIASAGKLKKVTAIVEDLAASAAYWLASQAKMIGASSNSMIGSIGVYQVVEDLSAMAAQQGIKVHVISSGPHKGAGVPGAPLTVEQLAGMQEIVDGLSANFVGAVASGRGVSIDDAKGWANGQIWLGQDALEMGLIDSLDPKDWSTDPSNPSKATAAHVGTAARIEAPNYGGDSMEANPKIPAASAPETPVAPQRKPATVAELRAAFPKDSEFAMAQLEAGATLLEAKSAFADLQTERLAKVEKENAELRKAKPAAPRGAAPLPEDGTDPSQSTDAGGEDKFMAAAREYKATHKCDLFAAMSAVRKQRPELFQAHLAREEREAGRIQQRRKGLGVGTSTENVGRLA